MANNDMWAEFGKDILNELKQLGVRLALVELKVKIGLIIAAITGSVAGSIITLIIDRLILK